MEESIPTADAIPLEEIQMVEVVSPATLRAGYTFPATFRNVVFTVTVPEGGLKQGQRCQVPFRPSIGEATPMLVYDGGDEATTGEWKDHIFSCCRFGPVHPSLLNAVWCPLILLAQVLTRLQHDVFGRPSHTWKRTFRRILGLVVAVWLVGLVVGCAGPDRYYVRHNPDHQGVQDPTCPEWRKHTARLIGLLVWVYACGVLARVRRAVRERHGIPSGRAEDGCCAFWCSCCTVAQLARQTADYDQKRALCCSDTGLPPPVPSVLVPTPSDHVVVV